MSARTTHIENMIPELDTMRDAVAAAAREETDTQSHHAYMRQARSLRAMYGQITSTWFNVEQEVKAETGSVDEETVELRYAERLGQWLRAHARDVAETMEGGEIDMLNECSSFKPAELATTRLFAARHHDMVAEFCERNAEALDDRAAALRGETSPRP